VGSTARRVTSRAAAASHGQEGADAARKPAAVCGDLVAARCGNTSAIVREMESQAATIRGCTKRCGWQDANATVRAPQLVGYAMVVIARSLAVR